MERQDRSSPTFTKFAFVPETTLCVPPTSFHFLPDTQLVYCGWMGHMSSNQWNEGGNDAYHFQACPSSLLWDLPLTSFIHQPDREDPEENSKPPDDDATHEHMEQSSTVPPAPDCNMSEKPPFMCETTFWHRFVTAASVARSMNTACVCRDLTVISLWEHQFIWSIHTYLCHCQCNQLSGRFPGARSASCISLPVRAGKENRDC